MREMVAFALKGAGFAVIQGGNGQEGLARLDQAAADIVITDLNMPVMDGITFIRKLRTRPTNRFTPILMLTTESQESKKQEAKTAGATGWITKPFNPEQLLKVIAKVLP
jgi:two-component system chemotaxis response regulator CheY